MVTTALFGRLPTPLILPAETAQNELYCWALTLERRLECLWGDKPPAAPA